MLHVALGPIDALRTKKVAIRHRKPLENVVARLNTVCVKRLGDWFSADAIRDDWFRELGESEHVWEVPETVIFQREVGEDVDRGDPFAQRSAIDHAITGAIRLARLHVQRP